MHSGQRVRRRATGRCTSAHNAIRDSLLEGSALADHFIKAESADPYADPTRVDRVIGKEESQAVLTLEALKLRTVGRQPLGTCRLGC